MGLYRSVYTRRPCERCGEVHRAEVQFKTGQDREMNVYEEGDLAPELAPGDHEGLGDAFCPPCAARWRADEAAAHFEEVAARVESGELQARGLEAGTTAAAAEDPRAAARAHTPAELRALGRRPDDRPTWPNFPARLLEARISLWKGELRVFPLGPPPAETGGWWEAHRERVRVRLAAQGWRAPADESDAEMTVRIGEDRRIRVVALPGARGPQR